MESKNKDISRAAMMVALTVVLYATKGLPLFSIASIFLLPVPLVLLGSEKGPKILMMAIACVMVCLALSFGWISSIIYFLLFGAISLILGVGFYYKISLMTIFMIGAVSLGGLSYFEFQFGGELLGIETKKELDLAGNKMVEHFEETNLTPLKESLDKSMKEYLELVNSDSTSPQILEEKKLYLDDLKKRELVVLDLVKRIRELITSPMPLFMMSSFFMLFLTFFISVWMAKRFRFGDVPPVDFSNWQCPGIISWIFVICVIGTSYISSSDFSGLVEIMKSISFTMEFMYFLFGLSFVTFLAMRWKLSRTSRVLLYLVSLFYWNFLIMIGLMDSLVNMRKLYIVDVNKGA
ncbi:MAG: hypothetical protein COB02_14420 [Candidatus Cloacimonadota bacterium]|nr:MAG: hypothetical protein COB02_14420 [Candidatus Cloacimonadota bacterium]